MIFVAKVLDESTLHLIEKEVTFSFLAVSTLTGIAADGKDCHIRTFCYSCDERHVHLHFRKNRFSPHICRKTAVRHILDCVVDIFHIPPGRSLVNFETVADQTIVKIANIFLVHISGTCTAGDEVIGGYTIKCYLAVS